jgi:uncharacterized membrane protein YqaE (UPF0057 family)
MKKSLQVIIMLLCSGILLSSCSRLSDISITKRHYRGGYYVNLGGSHKQNKAKHEAPATAPADEIADAPISTAPAATEPVITAPVAAAVTPAAPDKLKEKSTSVAEKTASELLPAILSAAEHKKKQTHKEAGENVYASTQNISEITDEIQATFLKNSIDLNISKEHSIISRSAADSSGSLPMWLMVIFAIILPPLAVGLKFGIIDKFWISCLLTLLFWIPGVIYAIYWITK